jgi:DNA-binding CsgD family transcriptional regulator
MDPFSPVSASARAGPPTGLRPRDVELLHRLADGKSTAQIAAILAVSGNTVRTRIRRVAGKLDVTGRDAAVRAAWDLGVLGIPRPRRPIG